MDKMEILAAILSLNQDGRLIGKTRLQKTIYFLEALGLHAGFYFEYHNYGPFSDGVAQEIDFARYDGIVKAHERTGHHEVQYWVYETKFAAPDQIGDLTSKFIKSQLGVIGRYSAVALEIGATLHFFLQEHGDAEFSEREVIRHKRRKATPERIREGWQLVDELGLRGASGN